jgi:hypothetical protein
MVAECSYQSWIMRLIVAVPSTYDSINTASVSQGHVLNVCLWEEAVLSSKMSDEICGLLVFKNHCLVLRPSIISVKQ